MGLTGNIIIFTMIYFFLVLGISLCFATLGALISRSVDEKNQGEIMGMSSSFESLISILAPIVFTGLYTSFSLSPYLYIAFLPLIAFAISRIFFHTIVFDRSPEHT
jgi:MFS family permease